MNEKITMKLKKYDDTFNASEAMDPRGCVCVRTHGHLCVNLYAAVCVGESPFFWGLCVHADLKHFCTALSARFLSKRTQTKPNPNKKVKDNFWKISSENILLLSA